MNEPTESDKALAEKTARESLEGFAELEKMGITQEQVEANGGDGMKALCEVFLWLADRNRALEAQVVEQHELIGLTKDMVRVNAHDFKRLLLDNEHLKVQRDALQTRGSELALERQTAKADLERLRRDLWPDRVPLRAGDHVFHMPSGETWVLACDEEGGEVMPMGWPETYAKAEHCRLTEAATDEARIASLEAVSKSHGDRGESSRRSRRAAYQLQLEAASRQVGSAEV